MDSEATRGILRDIHTLYTLGTMGGRTDAELLERFLARGDSDAEDAFATLVARAWADGAGRLPKDAAGLARCGGRLPGDVLRSGAAGRVDRAERASGELALQRRGADRPGGPPPGRPAARGGKATDG